VETSYGGNGNLNPDLMNPQPSTTYVVDHHVFEIDDLGRTVAVHIDELALGDAYRSDSIQSRIGDLGGPGYDGGHLGANVFGGGTENINMVAMLKELNRGPGNSYFNLENSWRALLKTDPPPVIRADIYPEYIGSSKVPDTISIEYFIDAVKQDPKVFENVNR
jgi:DNA/RNA non-specific endonuclease